MNNDPNIEAAERFGEELTVYLNEFTEELTKQYTRTTVRRYEDVIDYMVEHLIGYHSPTDFDQITLGMVSSKFRQDYYSNTDSSNSVSFVKSAVKKYFQFIYDVYGIRNEKLLMKLSKY